MIYRKCGNSSLKLPIISLGLWHNFGNVDSYFNAKKIIHTAFDNGITHFDLANNYGPPPGSAEKNFGRILKSGFTKHRDEIIVSSKAGYHMWEGPYGEWGSKKHIISSLDQSLKRTGLEYFDIFYSHRFEPGTPLEETMGALDFAIRKGKALYAGISNYNPEQTRHAVEVLRKLGTPCLIHQTNYSMLNRKPESGLLNVLKKEKIGCIAFSPLAQGLLTDKYLYGISAGSRSSKSHGFLKPEHITENKIHLIKKLNEFAKTRNRSLAQLAFVWVLRKDSITSVLIGASSDKQILIIFNLFNDSDKKHIETAGKKIKYFQFYIYRKISLQAINERERNTFVNFILEYYEPKNIKIKLLPFLKRDEFYILNIPMDVETPPGRYLRPQAMCEEYITRNWAYPVSYRMNLTEARKNSENEKSRFYTFLDTFKKNPRALITDSQAIDIISKWTPPHIPVTTFSIMMINYMSRGKLAEFVSGIKKIDNLKKEDKVLIAEACNHSRINEDIGTVQIPNYLKKKYPDIIIEHNFGREFQDNQKLAKYKLVIHCGDCMISQQKLLARLRDLDAIRIIYNTRYGNHSIRRINVEVAPLSINVPFPVSDNDFKKIIAIIRIAMPYTGIILTTRETKILRNGITLNKRLEVIDILHNLGSQSRL